MEKKLKIAVATLLVLLTACVAPDLSPDQMRVVMFMKIYQNEKELAGEKFTVLGEVKGRNGSKVAYPPLLPMKTPPIGPALDEAKAEAVKLGANAAILKEVKELGATLKSWNDLECTLIAIKMDSLPAAPPSPIHDKAPTRDR